MMSLTQRTLRHPGFHQLVNVFVVSRVALQAFEEEMFLFVSWTPRIQDDTGWMNVIHEFNSSSALL